MRFGLHAADAALPLSAWDEVERHWPPSAIQRAAAEAEPAEQADPLLPRDPQRLGRHDLERSVAAPRPRPRAELYST